MEAATHFAEAASILPSGSTYADKRIGYITRQAIALYQRGSFGDNGALRLAIELYQRLIELIISSRERAPLRWAAIQNNLGNALRVLGGRENGTANLDEAVAAYREALKELDRKRRRLIGPRRRPIWAVHSWCSPGVEGGGDGEA